MSATTSAARASLGTRALVLATLAEASAVFAGLFALTKIQHNMHSDITLAQDNATLVQRWEGPLSVVVERVSNQWLAQAGPVAAASALLYSLLLAIPLITLGWVWWWHRAAYAPLRNSLCVLTFAALPLFAFFPVAPPRLHVPGTIDIVERYGLLGTSTTPGAQNAGNLYAATPSLHVAWACWSAYAVFVCLRGRFRRAAHLAWALPALAALDVVVTGNHYLLDVATGAGLTAGAIGVVAAYQWVAGRRDQRDLVLD